MEQIQHRDLNVKHTMKPKAYLRYGDDFIVIETSKEKLLDIRQVIIHFINKNLHLFTHQKNDIIIKATQGLRFLGAYIFPNGRKLNKRNWQRVKMRLNRTNVASYSGLVRKHSNHKKIRQFNWHILDTLKDV